MIGNGIAVITGACGGMGTEISRQLGRRFALALTDLDQTELDKRAADLRTSGFEVVVATAFDIRQHESIDRLIADAAAMGPIRAGVHAAGASPPRQTDWKEVMAVNLVACAYFARAILEKA